MRHRQEKLAGGGRERRDEEKTKNGEEAENADRG